MFLPRASRAPTDGGKLNRKTFPEQRRTDRQSKIENENSEVTASELAAGFAFQVFLEGTVLAIAGTPQTRLPRR
ncbi:MAG TPA: hypothetical protein DCG89_03975 [Spartobacteria bacterium]|nr:hypothetical protein [Spartobacteria bacterium]